MKINTLVRFDLNTHICRPLGQVFSFVATPENDFQWQYGTLTSAQISRGEIGRGTLFRVLGHLMGRRVETTYEVIVFELNQRYGFKSVSGQIDSYTLYAFQMAKGGTKINVSIETNPKDVFKPNDDFVVKKFRKEFKENLAMLKMVLETQHIVKT